MASSNAQPVIFETVNAGTIIPHGDGTDGTVGFTFFTPDGTMLLTYIGPRLAREFASSLAKAIKGSPTPDFAQPDHARDVPGKSETQAGTVTYFDQEYPTAIVQALGVLLIRVNLIERSLVRLLAALMDQSEQFAEAMFYSISNNRAHLDLIASVLPHARLIGHEQTQIEKALLHVAGLARRRNALIHGHWEFTRDKFAVHTYEPNSKGKKSQVPVVTEKSILQLAADFRTHGALLEGFATTLTNRNMASQATATPT